MPSEGINRIGHREILSYEEIARIVRVAAGLGVRKVRITGENLLRGNILPVSLHQSGRSLDRGPEPHHQWSAPGTLCRELADAGLHRVNVSLDSLRPDRYREITRGGDISRVMKGIEQRKRPG